MRTLAPKAALFLAIAATTFAACDDDPTEPAPREGVAFELSGDRSGSFVAEDTMDVDDQTGLPEVGNWAIAADPDSLGGIVLSAFEAAGSTEGDLFLLQLSPVREGTFEPCGPNEPCRGRIFFGLLSDFSSFDEWFEVVDGEVVVTELGDTRVKGTFELTLRSDGGAGEETLTLEDGSFDVPFAGTAATGVIKCRIIGLGGDDTC